MLSVQQDGTIQLTRGDTARINVSIKNDSTGQDYEICADDELVLTVKKNIEDEVPILQKKIQGTNMFHIKPEDTKNMEFGKYKYDIQINTGIGDVYTVIVPSTFELLKEVTV